MEIMDALDAALQKSTADLSILRWMKREQLQTTAIDSVLQFHQSTFQGVSCRSLINKSWGFSSTTDIKDAPKIVKTAEKLARIPSGEPVEIADTTPVSGEWNPRIEPVTISDMDYVLELIKEADQASKEIPYIVSIITSILCVTDEKILVTSEGTRIYQVEPRIMGTISVVAKESQNISRGTETIGGQTSLKSLEKTLTETAVTLSQKVSRTLHATLPPTRKTPVVLSGDVVGLLAHEAIGHAAEADIAQHQSFLSHKEGNPIVSPLISIVDDGTFPKGLGTYRFDDEGTPSQNTTVIRNGVLESYLHSRETAHRSNVCSTGNARAWLFSREPTVRMSNTYLLCQDMSLEELFQQVKNGLYISGDKGGSADRNGQFMFGTSYAQKIEKGELTEKYFLGPIISGDALEAFTKCTGVGNEDTFVLQPAVCSKGESAFVGSGGPAVAAEVVVGGIL